ncbi:hypothetical protein OsJ_13642 [Oryza sativa Japonica Group]|nr:hypothetical protein OsJ_13642 [Oryza sativa Japonica Group]
MAFDLLCDISLASRGWKIRARIARMWDYTGTANDVPPMHVDLVLVDEKGNAMYAEIPGVEADKFRPLLQESKVYTFSKFLVLPSKPAYKPFPNKYMIKLTPWTNVEQVNEVPADFPSHVFNLVQFSDLSQRVGMQEYFTDVIGMIIGVSKLAYVRMASKTSDTPKRVIALRDLANCEVKLVLWGEHALDFDADAVHSVGQDNVVVGIFVGTLMKAYNKTLSGGSACKWYLNEDIPEINQFFDSLGDSAPKIQWISAGAKSFGSSQRPAQLEHKSVADLKKIDPWEAAKFTFAVSVTERSLMHRNISFQVNGIETFFGRQGSIPQPREQGPSAGPSTPLALVASGMNKDDASQSHELTPVNSSTSTADPVDELPGDSKKRKSIVRHPLAAQKKLTFETAPSSKENTSPVDPPASSSRTDDQAADKQHAVPHEVDVSQIAAASAEPNTQVKDILPTEAKKKSVDPGSTGTRKTKPPVPKGN